MGGKRKDIGDFSVLKRVLRVERDTEQTLQSRRRICEERIAQTRLEVDTLLQEAHRRIVSDETTLQVRTDRAKKQIEKEFEEATSRNISEIEKTAVQNSDLAIGHILSLLEDDDIDGESEKSKSDKKDINNKNDGEGRSEGAT